METREYFAPEYSSIEDVIDKHGPIYDATTIQKVADCPRSYQIYVLENLTRPGKPVQLVAGIAIHAGLEYYYSRTDRKENPQVQQTACVIAQDVWDEAAMHTEAEGQDEDFWKKNGHFFLPDFFLTLLNNYFTFWNNQVETYHPIHISYDDLRLDDVIAARFRLNEQGDVVLGESNLIMKFGCCPNQSLILAGKPDLPVVDQEGHLWVMDHKSTGSNLGSFFFDRHKASNKDRGYMMMIHSLMGTMPKGYIINGILTNKYALNPKSTAVKYARHQYPVHPDHAKEGLRNQKAWIDIINYFTEKGYWPQGCGWNGCRAPALCCAADPDEREMTKLTDYIKNDRTFWDL